MVDDKDDLFTKKLVMDFVMPDGLLLLNLSGSNASSTSPHMWLADGDSLMCYIVRMSRLIA